MNRKKSLVSWLFFAGGAALLLQGSSSLYPMLFPAQLESPVLIAHTAGAEPSYSVPPGTPIFEMSVPRLQRKLAVVAGTTPKALRKGPGHLEGTSIPGLPGNTVIAGHRDTHFRMLKDVQIGDEIWIQSGSARHVYRVTGTKVVRPDDLSPLESGSESVLTLITCYPFYFVGPAPKRFIVKATLS